MDPILNAMLTRCQHYCDALSPDGARRLTVAAMPVSYQAELRRRVREAMAAKGWEEKQLAAALRHPHRQTVQRWLSDDPDQHRAISLDNLPKIAKALGVTVKHLDPDGTQGYDPNNRPPPH